LEHAAILASDWTHLPTRRPLQQFDVFPRQRPYDAFGNADKAWRPAGAIAPFRRRSVRHGTFIARGLSSDHYADIFDRIESGAMVERERFLVPSEVEEILERLPPQVTLHVPDHILSRWFPSASAAGSVSEAALARVASYAQSCGCEFRHRGGEGIFYRPAQAEN
jgi:hypothetical protein